ncbi:hypothetical protein Pcinc_010011 [Petrolisthes cinctipes]|uniref:Uncharacterized protein n=1 Tax=Petrolisthes cinctipes TaxID=88211 RepID=A0AAE1KVV8_PETCI|nr:hypothetical protein Pcinc_010011 [Petrolisthes cinctipes]
MEGEKNTKRKEEEEGKNSSKREGGKDEEEGRGEGPMDSILASVIKADEAKKTKAKDLSIYRTPSGNDNKHTNMY